MCVCVCVLGSINDTLGNFLVKDAYFLTEHVPLYYIAFSTVSVKKECLFLCYVFLGNNIAFVFDLM